MGMIGEVVTYDSNSKIPQLDSFVEALRDQNLRYKASKICNEGLQEAQEVKEAVDHAMNVCANGGLSINDHFKPIYISDDHEHTLSQDWQLSRLGYALVMLNGHRDNPHVCKLQIKLIEKLLNADQGA